MMDLNQMPLSAPRRSIIMLGKELGFDMNFIDLCHEEHLKSDFVEYNPQDAISTLVDNGYSIWESHCDILIYLVEQSDKNDSLYPKDVEKRDIINQRLYFDMVILYQSFANYYFPQVIDGKPADTEDEKKIGIALDILNTFLEGQKYVAGDTLSIADIAILATISSFVACEIDITKYPNIKRWYDHTQTVVLGWEENWDGCLEFKEWVFAGLKKN